MVRVEVTIDPEEACLNFVGAGGMMCVMSREALTQFAACLSVVADKPQHQAYWIFDPMSPDDEPNETEEGH